MDLVRLFREIPANLKVSIALLFLIILMGTIGFYFLEGFDFFTAFYFTVITITTVGYGDVVPITSIGKIFSVIIIVTGVSVVLYTFTAAMAFSMEGSLRNILGVSKMQEKINQLKGHIIVCGYGKVGKNIVSNLIKENLPFVVVEKDPAALEMLARNNLLHVAGDATYGETLDQAGILRGSILISCLSNDADNLYVIMEAKEMNPNIRMVLRASRPESVKRFLKIGADKVIMPEEAGANLMSNIAMEYYKHKSSTF